MHGDTASDSNAAGLFLLRCTFEDAGEAGGKAAWPMQAASSCSSASVSSWCTRIGLSDALPGAALRFRVSMACRPGVVAAASPRAAAGVVAAASPRAAAAGGFWAGVPLRRRATMP